MAYCTDTCRDFVLLNNIVVTGVLTEAFSDILLMQHESEIYSMLQIANSYLKGTRNLYWS